MGQASELHLNLNLLNAGTFAAAWRWPDSSPPDFYDTNYYIKTAQIAERGTFDALFLADFPALSDHPEYRPFQSLEPTVTLATVAAHTSHIGLIATASSTYNEPYNIARLRLARPCQRRANRPNHAARYERAAEFAAVVKALWDSWEDDALVADKESGRFVDTSRVYPVRHHGKHYSVDGALNVPRPPQGRPILVQAGGSDDGKDLAALHADAVFSVALSLADAHDYSRDLRARAVANGRAPHDILIFPGFVTVIGSTEAEAKRREEQLWDLVPLEYGLRRLAGILQVDPSRLALDEPLPSDLRLPADGMQTFFRSALTLAKRGQLTVRELIRAQGGGTGHRIIVGTPERIAADIEEWFLSGAVDGFNVMPDVIASELEAFLDEVVPLLRKRGIFRSAYQGRTLRDHFWLDRPERILRPTDRLTTDGGVASLPRQSAGSR